MLGNAIVETANSPGTGTVSLGGAATGRVRFRSQVKNGDSCYYFIFDGTQIECGIGTLTTGAPDTLSRDTVLWNSAGTTAKLNFSGTVTVVCEVPASRLAYVGANGGLSTDATAVSLPMYGGTATGGASGALKVSPTPAVAALLAGMRISFRVIATCVAGSTLQVSTLTAKALKVMREGSLRAVRAGDWRSGQVISAIYNSNEDCFVVDQPLADDTAWRLVGQTTLSAAAAAVAFALPSDMDHFVLEWDNATPAAAAFLAVRFSWDSGASYRNTAGDYGWLHRYATVLADTAASDVATATEIRIGPSQTAGGTCKGRFSFGRVSRRAHWDAMLVDSGGVLNHARGSGFGAVAGAITNVRLYFSGQNMQADAKVRLLGGLA